MKLQGKSNPEIIRTLKAKGFSIPIQLLSDIFRNVFYCGYYSHNLLNGELLRGKQPPMMSKSDGCIEIKCEWEREYRGKFRVRVSALAPTLALNLYPGRDLNPHSHY